MKLSKEIIIEIIGDNRRFISPYHDQAASYCILDNADPLNEEFDAEIINRYYDKLRYAVSNADALIKEAFQDKFYDAYFIDRSVVRSPAQMCSELIFDSFVMYPDHQTIGACLSSNGVMSGHFIDVAWDSEWNIISVWIN